MRLNLRGVGVGGVLFEEVTEATVTASPMLVSMLLPRDDSREETIEFAYSDANEKPVELNELLIE